jgi:hypothetical protein
MLELSEVTVASEDDELARVLMSTLLAVTNDFADGEERSLRAGYAVRAAVDLALLDVGVSPHGVLAAIENLGPLPSRVARVARATGRLCEHHDEAFLRAVLEERVLPHEEAAADATLELGLRELREAFEADDSQTTLASLSRAATLFDRASDYGEARPDARAFAAAARAALAFGEGGRAMAAALDRVASARSEFERDRVDVGSDFRGATPLRSVAAWQVWRRRFALCGHISTSLRCSTCAQPLRR